MNQTMKDTADGAALARSGAIDVVILGAGVNGAGLFRDLSAQGVNCLIVDKNDFGSGTSAAPSRLIHGGLKYLETGEFRLVAQSTLERNLLLKNAPHCVTPLPTVIPIFSWTKGIGAALRTLFGSKSAPRSRGALLIKAGLAIYDYYGSRNRVMPRHRMMGRRKALGELPALTPAIVATGIYYDAKVSLPERLVFELVCDGLATNPASAALNHTDLAAAGDGLLSFQPQAGGAPITVRPKLVINAAGPWIDHVNAALGTPSRMIGGTKGSHILLRHDALVQALKGQMIYFEADDGRICLVYDYLGLALVGSTDIPADNPDTVKADQAEIDYLIASLRALLPGLSFDPSQIVYAYAGIRPLPASNAATPGLISRDHSAPVLDPDATRPFPIISLVGGKWTTFRGFAEEVADGVLKRLGRNREVSTRTLAIGGGKDFPGSAAERADWVARTATASGLPPERVGMLLARYGTTAASVARHLATSPRRYEMLGASAYGLAEIEYIAGNEHVGHLADIVMRRTALAITGSLDRHDLEAIAGVAGELLDWAPERIAAEIESVVIELGKRNLLRIA